MKPELFDQAFDPNDLAASSAVAQALLEKGKHRFITVTLGANGVVLAVTIALLKSFCAYY